jgi:transitional endoplasmic reticulum ATPase
MADFSSHSQSYDAWRDHKSKPREDTGFVTQDFLASTHPDYHLTRTQPSSCDLLGYAHAGNAKAIREADLTSDSIRSFAAPGSRLETEAGHLKDDVKFGRWKYNWHNVDFLVYEGNWKNRYLRDVKYLFVLAPRSAGAVVDGHHRETDALLLEAGAWTKELHGEIYVFDDAKWSKDKKLWKSVQDASWDDVILDPAMKSKLIHDVEGFFDNRELYKSMNIPWKRGVILHGLPGNGKTISIKALINTLAARPTPVQSLYVKSLDSCPGPKWSMQQIFSHARLMAPCLLILEDLDSLVEDKTRSYFLNQVDGLESNDGILMIGSTNHLNRLDPAVTKRPSRFDRKYHFKLPNVDERVAYCQYWREKFFASKAVDFPEDICHVVANLTDGFSFAYLKELFITSLLILTKDGDDEESEITEDQSEETESTSTSDAVVVEKTDGAGEEKVVPDLQTEQKKSAKPKRVMPDVAIPESLRDNTFMRILKLQAKALLDEMESANETAAKKGPACAPNPFLEMAASFMPDTSAQ